jgi:hypothetical protein
MTQMAREHFGAGHPHEAIQHRVRIGDEVRAIPEIGRIEFGGSRDEETGP